MRNTFIFNVALCYYLSDSFTSSSSYTVIRPQRMKSSQKNLVTTKLPDTDTGIRVKVTENRRGDTDTVLSAGWSWRRANRRFLLLSRSVIKVNHNDVSTLLNLYLVCIKLASNIHTILVCSVCLLMC
jgi:hypothetical protein